MRALSAFVILLAVPIGDFATAQTVADTDDMGVSITIEAGCTVTANDLGFGTSQVITSNIDAQTTVLVTCTNGTDYEISADDGDNSSNPAARMMALGGEDVQYSIYTDAGRTTVWDDNTGVIAATGTGSQVTHTVYGRVPSPQVTPTPGTYIDTVTVTVSFPP